MQPPPARRTQVRSACRDEASAPGIILRQLLSGNASIQRLTDSLLAKYRTQPEQAWRLIWLIYLIEQAGTAGTMKDHLERLEASKQMPLAVRLWARRCREGRSGEPLALREEVHDLSYLDAGLRCYGETPCKDDGF